jgi:uncharacterized protein YifE (UPF0438 family)
MAIFSMNIAKVSKSNGKSAVNSSAYIHRERWQRSLTGEYVDYRYKMDEPIYSEMLLPKNAPLEYSDPKVLWNAVEKIETNSNALLARRVILALPLELSLSQNKQLLHDYCIEQFVDKGMCADTVIHWKEGNPHAHVLLTTRPFKENGDWGIKEKKIYKLDEKGERIPQLDAAGNQKLGKRNEKLWERVRVDRFEPNEKMAETWREAWKTHVNQYLQPENYIDNKSYQRQGLDITPQIHVGYSPRKAIINDTIKKIQSAIKHLADEIKSLKTQIFAFDKESEIDYINKFPKEWDELDIERYEMQRDMSWQEYSLMQSAVGIKTTDDDYIEFCKGYAPTSEKLAQQEKIEVDDKPIKINLHIDEPEIELIKQKPKQHNKQRYLRKNDDFEI